MDGDRHLLPAAGVDEAKLLAVAAGVEAGSSHPLAPAILRRAEAAAVQAPAARDARAPAGRGIEARVDGALAWVASAPNAAEAGGDR